MWLAIGLGIVAVAAFVLTRTLPPSVPDDSPQPGELKAAIVDQLYNIRENQTFIEYTTQELKDYGFEVDVYQGDDVTVDLYRQLPTYGYKFIIFRVHSGLLVHEKDVGNRIWLFTSEPYDRMRHFFEQLRGQVTIAKTSEDAPSASVFAVGAKFITHGMEERFTNTAIIIMGCNAFDPEDLAQAFIQKGASTYIGWNASVGLSYVDDATTALVEKLFIKELTIAEAVAETMKEKGLDPVGNAVLKYYPLVSANKTLRQLIE